MLHIFLALVQGIQTGSLSGSWTFKAQSLTKNSIASPLFSVAKNLPGVDPEKSESEASPKKHTPLPHTHTHMKN